MEDSDANSMKTLATPEADWNYRISLPDIESTQLGTPIKLFKVDRGQTTSGLRKRESPNFERKFKYTSS